MDDQQRSRRSKAFLWIPLVLTALGAAAAIVVALWRRRQATQPQVRQPPPTIPEGIEGLTEAEAEARRVEGQDNSIYLKPRRTREDIIRDNVYTIFNLNLVGIAVAQAILRRPLDVLISIGMIFVNIGLNVGQEMFARRRIKDITEATRAKATVLREGRAHSIDASEVVVGDILLVGPGDNLPVDGEVAGEGQFVVDESMLTGKRGRTTKRAGDPVYAGSFCLNGRGAYETQKVGAERLIVTRLRESHTAKEGLTPLERVIDRVLRVLLILVITFTVLLFLAYFKINPGIPSDVINDAASVIFSIAPSSLFFMILLTYAAGTADLAKIGALVHRARSVESLAQATVICFARAGILTGTQVELDIIEPEGERESLAESRIRQILGDYARSTSADTLAVRAAAGSFEGNSRPVYEEAPFPSVYGWSAVVFDDEDLRGVYVMGSKEILEPNLLMEGDAPVNGDENEGESRMESVRQTFAPLGRLFRRSKPEPEELEAQRLAPREPVGQEAAPQSPSLQEPTNSAAQPGSVVSGSLPATAPATAVAPTTAGATTDSESQGVESTAADALEAEEESPKPNFFGRLRQRVGQALKREDKLAEEPEVADEEESELAEVLFAYCPDLVPLYTNGATPQLPHNLIPLCTVRYSEKVRPEAAETIRTFAETGVDIKIFSSDAPERTSSLLQQAGIGRDDGLPLGAISGPELEHLSMAELAAAVTNNTIFGRLVPEQTAQIVDRLRRLGQSVAVVGDGVSDVAALRQADLAIARRSSSQAALSTADIILLEDAPNILQGVLGKGQRIANGLMDVLKLNLTHVSVLALLIVGVRLVAYGFPYQSAQGNLVNIAAVSLPAIGLSLWAAAGVLPRVHLGRLLARIFVPAAITMCVAGLFVYIHFLNETGDIRYAQLTLTYALVLSGLVFVLFVRPPIRLRWPPRLEVGDPRPTLLLLVILVLFLVLPFIGLARELLKIDFLASPEDYAFVGLVVLVWAVAFGIILWLVNLAYRLSRRLRLRER